jgi:hypothetical protein
VASGISQGSVLGPVLFVLFINDLPMEIKSKILIFADDTKLYQQILTTKDQDQLQEGVFKLQDWTAKWDLEIHPAKCKSMTVGRGDCGGREYFLRRGLDLVPIETTSEEKDLGVIFDNKLSFEAHIIDKIKKSNQILGLIMRCFSYLDESSLICLYKSMVRPQLEFSQVVWHPYLLKFIDQLEGVQRRATKLVPGLSKFSYPERLAKLCLPTLSYRRLRGDLIDAYKILNNIYDPEVTKNLLCLSNESRTRGNTQKLFLNRCKTNLGKNAFSIRVVKVWNMLPQDVMDSSNVKIFESRLDRFMKLQPIIYDYRSEIVTNNQIG